MVRSNCVTDTHYPDDWYADPMDNHIFDRTDK